MFPSSRWFGIVLRAAGIAMVLMAAAPVWAAKNVIIMVSDGGGCNTWLATSMYQGKVGKQVYDSPGWEHYLASTYPLNTAAAPTYSNQQDPKLVYDPIKHWFGSPLLKTSPPADPSLVIYGFATAAATDSAAAATALSTGVKTYKSGMNWSDNDKPLKGRTIAELAKAQGKAVGVVTSVPWCHATPAALAGAHSPRRDDYLAITNEMLNAPWIDVIMGTGHPRFDDNNQPLAKKPAEKNWATVGGEATWNLLVAGKHPAGWKLIETQADFEALANDASPPNKLLGTAQVAVTLQHNRAKKVSTSATTETSGMAAPVVESSGPFSKPMNPNVPSLATMTRGAIRCLEGNTRGFYLMVEGGAVDWANHGNNADRMIEEQSDFIAAVDAVVQWIETHGGWDENLLLLTADHDTGLMLGPPSESDPFPPLVDNGPGKLPGLTYHSKSHTNSLVPLYARGNGSQRLADLVRGTDEVAGKMWSISGRYVDNTDIFKVMEEAVLEP